MDRHDVDPFFSGVWFSALTPTAKVFTNNGIPYRGIRGSAPVSTQVGRGIIVDDSNVGSPSQGGYEHAQR